MSKILSVFNLPYEMTPKDLFCLFSELGRVEGAFIYNVVDNRGRRVGEVAMGSFYHAKKVRRRRGTFWIVNFPSRLLKA